jgi:hypothetical protein
MKLAITFMCLLFIGACRTDAQQLSKPEQPEQTEIDGLLPYKPQPINPENIHSTHKFFDLQGKITNGANLSVTTLDITGTCRTLADGGHEHWLPTQHCGPATVLILGGVALDISLSYILHRTGHHKLERVMEIAGSVDSVTGVAYTVTHGGKW